MPRDKLSVYPVQSSGDLKAFIQLPYSLYAQDPHWVPPLYFERRDLIDPKKNPFFEKGQAQLFLARRGEKTVGRISAHINERYAAQHGERVGHWGFFEVEETWETAEALWQAAETYFRDRQIQRVQGPFSYSINEESGLLISGFEEPMVFMSPYNPPYYEKFVERMGMNKAKDLWAWRFTDQSLNAEALEIAGEVLKDPRVQLVPFQKNRLRKDFEILVEIFNSAWKDNWGFIPMSSAEAKRMAHGFKVILDPALAFRVEVENQAAGVCFAVPNLCEITGDLGGRLWPTGWAKLGWRLLRHRVPSARLMILGIKEEFRSFALGGLSTLLMTQCAQRGIRKGYDWAELSWTLEDNERINHGISFMGGEKYKTFRIYEKNL